MPVKTLTLHPAGISNVTYIVNGEKQNYTCSTNLCRPAVSIQWYIDGRNVTNEAKLDVLTEVDEFYKSTSTLLYTGNNSDHIKFIHCETVNTDGRNRVKSTSKEIYIQGKYIALLIKHLAGHESEILCINTKANTAWVTCVSTVLYAIHKLCMLLYFL